MSVASFIHSARIVASLGFRSSRQPAPRCRSLFPIHRITPCEGLSGTELSPHNVRFRGLQKDTAHLLTLFAPSNLL